MSLDDPERLAALRATELLDSPADPAFDRLTMLAAGLLRAPVAMVTLVDDQRQFFKSQWGVPEPVATARGTPLSHSFCKHVAGTGDVLVVDDARTDARVADNPAVSALGVAAYLGAPMTTRDGHTLGALCAIDMQPRHWSEREIEILRELAGVAVAEIALGQALARAAEQDLEARQRISVLERQGALLATVLDSMDDAVAVADRNGRMIIVNAAARRMGAALAYQPPIGRAIAGETLRQQDLDVAGRWHSVNASPLRSSGGVVIGGIAVGRDVTEAKDMSRALASEQAVVRLLLEVATLATLESSPHRALQGALDRICKGVGWPVGHIYRRDGGDLVPTDLWYLDHARFAPFRDETRSKRFGPQLGLVAEVERTGEAQWLASIGHDDSFGRATVARALGLETGFAAPIRIGREVAAVLELYTTETRGSVADVSDIVPQAAILLGRVLERERAGR